MKNIRLGVFETNSSSSHSISISNDSSGLYDTLPVDDNGVIFIECNEFGWDWEKIHSPSIKASYALTYALNYNREKVKTLIKVIKNHTGAKRVITECGKSDRYFGSRLSWGYIDHQSVDACLKAFESEDSLKNFIFNPLSFLVTGNDNDVEPPNFRDPKDIQYNYELVLEKCNTKYKFVSLPNLEDLEFSLESIVTHSSLDEKYHIGYSSSSQLSSFAKMKFGVLILYSYNREKPIELKFSINKI